MSLTLTSLLDMCPLSPLPSPGPSYRSNAVVFDTVTVRYPFNCRFSKSSLM